MSFLWGFIKNKNLKNKYRIGLNRHVGNAGLNRHVGNADAIVRRMKGGSACHMTGNTIKIRVDIIRSAFR
jgi:hypothetical protein